MKPRIIKDQYDDIVTVEDGGDGDVLVVAKQTHGGDRHTVMDFSPEQSRALRKALKRAEQAA